jgi:hypothetical protein
MAIVTLKEAVLKSLEDIKQIAKTVINLSFFIYLLLIPFFVSAQNISTKKYRSFEGFSNTIDAGKYVRMTELKMRDTLTSIKKLPNGRIKKSFKLSVENWHINFIINTVDAELYSGTCSIHFNSSKITLKGDTSFEGLNISGVYKFTLGASTYLVFKSWPKDCNGMACRMGYTQLFTITGKQVRYEIIDGWQSPENEFCDLNNDGRLDMICYTGECFSKNDSVESNNPEKYFFCIQALTRKNDKWVAMTDSKKRPYYVYMQTDDFFELDTIKIIEYNWMTKL